MRIAVLISGRGTNLQALIDACAEPSFSNEIANVSEKISGVDSSLYQAASTDMNVMEEIKTQLAADAVRLGEGRPSMAQDVMKGRRTEINQLNGYVANRGNELGVETPICESIVEVNKDRKF